MQRFGQIIKVKPECIAEYKRLHAAVYPGVLATIHACNMRNYSIFRHGTCLFAYFEYVGADIAADMKKMAELWSTLHERSICLLWIFLREEIKHEEGRCDRWKWQSWTSSDQRTRGT